MAQFYDIADTIAAIATPPGTGGIGIVRLSGPRALAIADEVFVTRRGVVPSQCPTHTVQYGDVVRRRDQGSEIVDEALVTVMRAPRSYTCEDVVEISCHGGAAAVNAVLRLVLTQGARLAGPGEFTRRAFLNGRIDLTQAEAVLDVIHSQTETGLVVSEHQLKGDLARRLEEIRRQLMDLYVRMEGEVNFPQEDEPSGWPEFHPALKAVETALRDLLRNADQGRVVREGLTVVLCGRPNVGKSSLMNRLLRQPRAIVSGIAGTTRDTIVECAHIGGIPLQIVDTAGILDPRDEIEQEAVRRSHDHIARADLVLFLLDAGRPVSDRDRALAQSLQGRPVITVLNKSDLPQAVDAAAAAGLVDALEICPVSALMQDGIGQLQEAILRYVLHGRRLEPQGILLSNVRHIDLLTKSLEEILAVRESGGQTLSLEFCCEHLKQAIRQLDRVTGRDIDADLIDQIFSKFCVGK